MVQPPPKLLAHLSDDRLVARVRAGDDRAFEVLYDRHHRALLAFCRHLLGSTEEAEDALQHTFIAAHRALRTDQRPVALRAWLFTIARNRCLSLLRTRRNVVAITPEIELSLPESNLGLSAQLEQREDLKALVRDLHRLSEEQRAALVLAELGDLDHEEIANILGVRRPRVATLIFQARASLMDSRKARESDCRDIQEQLATLRGGALRRSTLRRHVEECGACQAFRTEVRRQRAAMALILPVAPSVGLKRAVLGAATGGGTAAGGAVVAAGGGGAAGVGLLGGGGAAAGGAVASTATATGVAVAGAPVATGAVAAAVGGTTAASVATAGVAAGGAAVAAKALGVKVLVAAAIAGGAPSIQAAAQGLGIRPSSARQEAPAKPAAPAGRVPTSSRTLPAPTLPTTAAKSTGGAAAGTPSSAPSSSSSSSSASGSTGTGGGNAATQQIGSGASEGPAQVVDGGGSGIVIAPGDAPASGAGSTTSSSPAATPAPTPAATTQTPAATTEAPAAPATTTEAPAAPAATTPEQPAEPATGATTPDPAPGETAPAEGGAQGSGASEDPAASSEPVATGASVDPGAEIVAAVPPAAPAGG